jgi:hypothetical protein
MSEELRPDVEKGRRSNLSRPSAAMPVMIGIGVIAAAAAAFFAFRPDHPTPPPPAPVAVAQDAGAVEAPEPPPAPPMPPVEQADARVRAALASLSKLAPWLKTEDLARRFVAAVNAVAEGRSPRSTVSFIEIEGSFKSRAEAGRARIDPSSWARYDAVVAVFSSLDAQSSAAAFRELHPLFDAAQREMGKPGTRFDDVLAQAIAQLLAVPVPDEPIELVASKGAWAYADPKLESLSAAQKHLLRMGPQNVRQVQSKLRGLRTALGLPEAPAIAATPANLP